MFVFMIKSFFFLGYLFIYYYDGSTSLKLAGNGIVSPSFLVALTTMTYLFSFISWAARPAQKSGLVASRPIRPGLTRINDYFLYFHTASQDNSYYFH